MPKLINTPLVKTSEEARTVLRESALKELRASLAEREKGSLDDLLPEEVRDHALFTQAILDLIDYIDKWD